MRRALISAFVAACASACAPTHGDAYLRAKAAGDRAYTAGRLDEAARSYAEAAEGARLPRDRDEARFLEASAYQRAHEWPKAIEVYRSLADEKPAGERSARAAFELAAIDIETGHAESGYEALVRAVHAFPSSGPARKALQHYLSWLDETRGPRGTIAWIDGALSSFAGTAVDEDLRYHRAKRLEDAGDLAAARDAYVACAERHPYPFGALFDDALWNASLLDEKLGKPDRAIEDLRAMLRVREVSTMNGSYERPRFSPAKLRIATLYRDRLHDHATARRELHELYTGHPTSILRDDALWQEAVLAREDGEPGEACSLVKKLVSELAQSRYVPCAHDLCESVPPQDGGRCHPYLERKPSDGGTDDDGG